MRVGVISDTHGLLRPQAEARLAGVDHILHAGDVGAPAILERLAGIAPLTAIRGNVDSGDWADALPDEAEVTLAGRRILMLHDLKALSRDPAGEGLDIVIAGHSHRPGIKRRGRVLYLNPGSAGRRRFRLPVTLAMLDLSGQEPGAALIDLLA